MKEVVVYGAGVFGKILSETFRKSGLNVVCVIDAYSNEKNINNIPVLRVKM